MPPIHQSNELTVFMNVPYDRSYERLFVALIASLISIGGTPHCVLEIAERGQGRLLRILESLEKCRISVHDLSRAGTPARFNMAFELGLAWLTSHKSGKHSIVLFEKIEHRLLKTLSDLRGIEPYIHKGCPSGVVKGVLDALASVNDNPGFTGVCRLSSDLWQVACELKHQERRSNLYSRTLYHRIVSAGVQLATERGFIQP